VISKKELKKSYGEFLARYPWQWFCTFTFEYPPHPESATKKFRLFVNRLNRELYGCRAQKHGRSVFWVPALEYHKTGVIHFHALMADVVDLNTQFSRLKAMKMWEEIGGYARIYPIDEKLEAVTSYVSKYVIKGGEISFSENLVEFESSQTRLVT
jgi:hypothetical protein